MPKETLWGKPTEWKENTVREILNWLSDEQRNEMFFLLNQQKIRDSLLEGLDENNCCDRLLEAYKSFAGCKMVDHPFWGKIINHPFFFSEDSFPILLGDRDKIHNLDTLTMDDISVAIMRSDGSGVLIRLSWIDSGIGRTWKPLNKELLNKAKARIIKFLKEYLNWKR